MRVTLRSIGQLVTSAASLPLLVLVCCTLLTLQGDGFKVLALAAGLLLVYAAATRPLWAMVALFVAAILPQILRETTLVTDGSWGQFAAGLQFSDVVLFAMLAAVVYRAFAPRPLALGHPAEDRLPVSLLATASLFAAWLVIEVLRNAPVYGVSALGEFRFNFLALAAPAYLTLFCRERKLQRSVFILLVAGSVVAPLVLIPVIGAVKGWGIGPTSRYLPADISLGLVFGLTALTLARRHGVLRVPLWLLGGLGCVVATVVVVDSHRSAWLAALVLLLALIVLGELPLSRTWQWGAMLALLVAVAFVALGFMNVDPVAYVGERGAAILNPEQDPTSAWRLAIWRQQLPVIASHPLAGRGFGGYWDIRVPELAQSVTVFPHSLYILILVKLGMVGFALYGATVVAVLGCLTRVRRAVDRARDPLGYVLMTLGLAVTAAGLTYSTVYGLDAYSPLWVGLGLAAAAGSGAARRRPAVQEPPR